MGDDRFEGLSRRFKQLVAYLRRLGHSEDDALDAAQTAMLEMWSRFDRIAPGAEWSYAKKTAVSRAINQATRVPKGEPLDDDLPEKSLSAEDKLLIADFHRRFREALDELPETTRLVLVLRRRGETFERIAAKLDIDPTAARSRASRAAEVLRERVGQPPRGVQWVEFGDDDDQ